MRIFGISIGDAVVALSVGVIGAVLAHRRGRDAYRTYCWACIAYVLISVAQAIASDYPITEYLVRCTVVGITLAFLSYFAVLGALVAFGRPKRVECFRCAYVQWPMETEQPPTPYDADQHDLFRKLHYAGEERGRTKETEKYSSS